GSGDDSGVSGDGGSDKGVGAATYSAMSALEDVAIGVWGQTYILALRDLGDGGVGADSSVSNAFVSSAEETGSSTGITEESASSSSSSSEASYSSSSSSSSLSSSSSSSSSSDDSS
ncbi:hypothetical protein Tco_0470166, partial [Tanacetum coccineum]